MPGGTIEFLGMLVNTNTVCQPICRTDTGGSYQNLQHGFSLSSLVLPLPGEVQRSNPGYSSSPTILLLPADRLTSSSQQHNQDYEVLLSLSQSSQEKLARWREHLSK